MVRSYQCSSQESLKLNITHREGGRGWVFGSTFVRQKRNQAKVLLSSPHSPSLRSVTGVPAFSLWIKSAARLPRLNSWDHPAITSLLLLATLKLAPPQPGGSGGNAYPPLAGVALGAAGATAPASEPGSSRYPHLPQGCCSPTWPGRRGSAEIAEPIWAEGDDSTRYFSRVFTKADRLSWECIFSGLSPTVLIHRHRNCRWRKSAE